MALPWPMRVLWVWPEGVAKHAPRTVQGAHRGEASAVTRTGEQGQRGPGCPGWGLGARNLSRGRREAGPSLLASWSL